MVYVNLFMQEFLCANLDVRNLESVLICDVS